MNKSDHSSTNRSSTCVLRFHCRVCYFKASKFEVARKHAIAAHRCIIQRCMVKSCSKGRLTKDRLRNHLAQHTSEERLVECAFCKQQNKPPFKADFTDTTAMRWHLCESHSVVLSASRLSHAFPELSAVYESAEEMNPDYNEWIIVVNAANNKRIEYDFPHISPKVPGVSIHARCQLCSYQLPDDQLNALRFKAHFRRHLYMLYKTKPYVCIVGSKLYGCQTSFPELQGLQKHVKDVHKLAPMPHSGLLIDRCIICNQSQNTFEDFVRHLHVVHNLKAIRTVVDIHYLNGIYYTERENPGLMFPFWHVKVAGHSSAEGLNPIEPTKPSLANCAIEVNNAQLALETSDSNESPPAFSYVDECRQVCREIQSKQQPLYWSKVVKKTYRRYVRHQQATGSERCRQKEKFEKKLEKRMRTCGKMTLKPVTVVKLKELPPA